jgi:hypothetical protein
MKNSDDNIYNSASSFLDGTPSYDCLMNFITFFTIIPNLQIMFLVYFILQMIQMLKMEVVVLLETVFILFQIPQEATQSANDLLFTIWDLSAYEL